MLASLISLLLLALIFICHLFICENVMDWPSKEKGEGFLCYNGTLFSSVYSEDIGGIAIF
jgi:hypothetical protein